MDYFYVLFFGLVAGFLIPIASGSGLFSLAGLTMLGVPPQIAIATNRMGGVGLWPPIIYKYHRAGLIVWKYVLPTCLIAIIGSTIGAHLVLAVPESVLKPIVAGLILFVLIMMVTQKELGIVRQAASARGKTICYLGYFFTNIYAGFFGSGQGIFIDFLQIKYFGLTILQSKATAAIPTYLFIITSITVFLLNNVVHLTYGIILAISMGLGGWCGAHLAILKGNAWLKQVFIIVTALMATSLLYQSF